MTTKAKPVESMNFEDALEELENIIRNLETGKTSLEQSIESYERGISLKTHCETKLREARMKIEKITVGPNGTLSTEPLDQ
ncbi:MAG: exodeoxyribonuclease VII small subunit [Alphaproteobacteria bacterium]|nr:exodeoxyribonuclease VII small subunit [Alphaproteobacteria bacterium]OIN87509.1 MAG: exodeoxyribonuclease VII small subunit [Alphaproteobacteria bacterium CG1_02_46_17]